MPTTISTARDTPFTFIVPNDKLVVTSSGSVEVTGPAGFYYPGLAVVAGYFGSTIENSGTISSGSSSGIGDGQRNANSGIASGTFTIENVGTISGNPGIDLESRDTVDITNKGMIQGSYLTSVYHVDISNSGIINAPDSAGTDAIVSRNKIFFNSGGEETVNSVTTTNNLDNSGTINRIVYLFGDTNILHNSGTINGNVGVGFVYDFNDGIPLPTTGTNVIDGIGGHINGSILGGPAQDHFDLHGQTVGGTIYGGGGNDAIIGTDGGDTIYGDDDFGQMGDLEGQIDFSEIPGNDVIKSGAGNDVVYGENGNDTIDGGTGTNKLYGGGGVDTASYDSSTVGVVVSLALQNQFQTTSLFASDLLSGFHNLTGSAYADTLTGDANDNIINGGAGNDTIDGGNGRDILVGGGGVDTVSYASSPSGVTVQLALQNQYQSTGGGGADYLSGFHNLTGSAFGDVLKGDGNYNAINGGAGADTIDGGGGADTLTGGAGADRFVYSAMSDSTTAAPDLITDFQHGTDKIDLTGLHLVKTGQIGIASSGGITTIFIDSDNNGHADMFIDLSGANVLTMSDIVTGIAAPRAVAAAAPVHHDLAASFHAVAVDHGLYG